MARGTNPPLEKYLSLAFSWDQADSHLWKSVTWSFRKGGEKGFANYAAQNLDSFIHLIETRAGRVDTDVYVALGTQRVAMMEKTTADGYPKAQRKINNIVSLKSIWLDIDVGKKDSYATTEDAFNALDDFIDKINLPDPTMEVLSGSGGLHIYWCTKDPIPLEAWIPLSTGLRDAALAYGLKFDPQVTVNAAGILRPPGTWNCKSMPPKPVLMMDDSSFVEYDYQQLVGALSPYVGPTAGMKVAQQSALSSQRTQNFTAGVGVAAPVGLDDVIAVCPVIKDIEARGGDGDPEPLWNQAILLASFTEDATAAAHRLSSGDKRYTQAETDKKLAEKVMARTQNPAIGWPQCATFHTLHKACQTCPLFAQNKSPLAFAKKAMPAPLPAPNSDPLMPDGYWRDGKQHVFTVTQDERTKMTNVLAVLDNYPVLDAAVDTETGHLVFRTKISGKDKWVNANIHSNMGTTQAAQAIAAGGVFPSPSHFKETRNFLVSWIQHLQATKRTIAPATYGWSDDGKSFTFDQLTYMSTGKDIAFRGASHDSRFSAKGELKPWQETMKLVYGNPSLEAVVASAFAAPLVDLIGSTSVVVSVCSQLSGIGKTTSMMLAQAVWGDPRTGMSALADTTNSVMKKVADLRNLPIYWDELRTAGQLEKVIELVFQITQGKAKARLNRDITQQAAPAFSTMFVVASNYGISDTVYSQTEATEAGGLRVFEIEAQPRASSQYTDLDARLLQKTIEQNYGNAGALYADFIVKNRAVIIQLLTVASRELNDRYHLKQKERYWSMTVASLIIGAELANRAGLTTFDIPALRACLEATLQDMRQTLKDQEHVTLTGPAAGDDVLAELLASLRGKHLLITDRINYGIGNPGLVDASATGDISRLADVWMQVGDKDGRIRLRTKPFNAWLRERKLPPKQVLGLFARNYVVSHGKRSIGAGVPFLDVTSQYRSECIDLTPISLSPGSSHGSS